jgi:hypothetical protein
MDEEQGIPGFSDTPRPRQSDRSTAGATRLSFYDILFKASAETMITIAADPKRLRAQPRI